MNIREIEKELKKAAKTSQKMTKEERERAIRSITAYKLPIQTRAGFGEFAAEQLCFVNKVVFFWHGVWLLIFLLAVAGKSVSGFDDSSLCILSLAPPVLLLCTTNETVKIYCRGLIEIEYTTKYSLPKVILLRLLGISLVTGGVLLLSCIPVKYFWGIHYKKALVYTLTPVLCMSGCLLKFMESLRGQQLMYAAFALYAGVTGFLLFGSDLFFRIFTADLFRNWVLVFWLALGANVFLLYRLSKKLEQYELLTEKAG